MAHPEIEALWAVLNERRERRSPNAIGEARLFAMLMMETLGWRRFRPPSYFEHEQDFFAQISDGTVYRVPEGRSDALMEALGTTHRTAFSRWRILLRLPREIWEIADEHDLAQRFLIELANMRDVEAAIARAHAAVDGSKDGPVVHRSSWQRKLNEVTDPAMWEKLRPTQRHFVYMQLKQALAAMEERGYDRSPRDLLQRVVEGEV